jgi:hypothetical protein
VRPVTQRGNEHEERNDEETLHELEG